MENCAVYVHFDVLLNFVLIPETLDQHYWTDKRTKALRSYLNKKQLFKTADHCQPTVKLLLDNYGREGHNVKKRV